jgi:hypothetical protein
VSWLDKSGLFRRRNCCVPNHRGWAVLITCGLGVGFFVVHRIDPFLSVSCPVSGEILVVESWLPDYALFNAVGEFKRRGYKYVIATGPTLPDAGALSRYPTAAEFAAAKLAELGLPPDRIVAVPSGSPARDRTYSSGIALKHWLEINDRSLKALDVYSLGTHARRSRLLFQKTLGKKVKVGIIACPDSYDSNRWWATSEGVRTVTSEGLAYVYARFIFPLLPHKGDNPIQPNQHLTGLESRIR